MTFSTWYLNKNSLVLTNFKTRIKYDFMRQKKYRQTSTDYIRHKFRLGTATQTMPNRFLLELHSNF